MNMVNLTEGPGPWVNGATLARILEVSRVAVSRAKKSGRIKSINASGMYHQERAAQEFREHKNQVEAASEDELSEGVDLSGLPTEKTIQILDKAIKDFEEGKAPPENGKFTYGAARAIRAAIEAKEAWIKLQKHEASIISRTDAIAQVQLISKHNRDSWLNFPQLVAVEMAEQLGVDSGVLHDLLLREVKDYLFTVATMDIQLPGLDQVALNDSNVVQSEISQAGQEEKIFDFEEELDGPD